MRCCHCSLEIDNDAQYCRFCGKAQNTGEFALFSDRAEAGAESGRVEPPHLAADEPVYVPPVVPVIPAQPRSMRPVLQLPTSRGLLKLIFLGLVTLGIYNIVIFCKLPTEVNIVASRYDGKRTMPYFAMCAVAPLTLFILPVVWIHKLCSRIGDELNRRGCGYKFSAASFWLWNVLGSLILVGPFVFQHKLMKAMNLINGSFNEIG